ncbi:tRNA (guanine(46)-N(7))-methyltransferase TrmB [Maritalea sp.]|jgi:tRNA (guanine-N7-)-methyltransferase|uniref:tRNA (guanine(46)-N(7))-methyltransferase TrmB n=1 Tax=Maritalea sp. TaxID=2003361 RepID=UPI0039E2D002
MSPASTSHLRKKEYGLEAERKAFFGRRSAHKLHPTQQKLADELLPKVKLDLGEGPLALNAIFEHQAPKNFIEIGYGGGEHLARQARENRDANFIGCEPFIGGIGKMLAAINDDQLTNVKLFTDDALHLLKALPEASFDGAYLLYPDPWPKKRHHKRRFVNAVTLSALARILKPGAEFRVATDIEDYATWALGHILRHDQFDWPQVDATSWHEPWDGWQSTRYEQKARKEGRNISFYFSFIRT